MIKSIIKDSKNLQKKSIIFTWLLSYVLLIMVQSTIYFIGYAQTKSIMEAEINSYSQSRLVNLKAGLENKINEAEQLIANISLDPEVQSFLGIDGEVTDEKSYQMLKTIENLALYKKQSEYIENFFVYFKNSGRILTSSNSETSQNYYKYFYECNEMSYSQWVNTLFNSENKGYLLLPTSSNGLRTGKQLAICRQLPIENRIDKDAVVVVILNDTYLLDTPRDDDVNNTGSVFVINSKNEVLLQNGDLKWDNLISYEELEGDYNNIDKKIDNEKFVISYISTKVSDWKIVSVISASVFWNKMRSISNFTMIAMMLVVIIQLLIAYYFIKRNYDSIKKIMNAISENFGFKNSDKNELSYIENAISLTAKDQKSIMKTLRKQENHLKNDLIIKIIKEKHIDVTAITDELAKFEIFFDAECFVVGIFYNDDSQNLFVEETSMTEQERDNMARYILENIVHDLSNKYYKSLSVEIEDMVVCFWNIPNNKLTTWKNTLSTLGSEICSAISTNFNMCTTIAFGGIHAGIEEISTSYAEALETFEYKLLLSTEGYPFYDDINETTNMLYNYSLKEQQSLIDSIKDGDYEHASFVLNRVFEQNFKENNYSVSMVKCFMVDMISSMIRAVNEIFPSGISNDLIDNLNPIHTLLECNSVKQLKSNINSILKEICNYVKNVNDKNVVSINDKVISFIKEQYNDVNFSMSYVGEKFGMSPSYISKLFKQEHNISMLDYLNEIRIEKAKELLTQDSGMNLDSIATNVGYSGRITFTRIFKKYEGITPGVYKENHFQNKK